MASPSPLQRTPLFAVQTAHGAHLVGFGGWEMPVAFAGILEEHRAVRQQVGLFDISHMGEFIVRGPAAAAELNRLLMNDVTTLAIGQAQYSFLGNDQGGIIDDLIVYRLAEAEYLLVVNAANIATDFAWLEQQLQAAVQLLNQSAETAAVALQGPAATQVLPAVADLPRFTIASRALFGIRCQVARTGYTGEDGFEILCPANQAEALWNGLLQAGAPFGIQPCGLGARDTLRLEMCYPLHGQDISPSTTPLEAGLGRWVALDKPEFIGRAALLAQKQAGLGRRLVAFQMSSKSPPPRSHYPIRAGGQPVGEVTSGTQSPSLGTGIGMGYVPAAFASPGTALEIEIRGRLFPAVVQTKPLWKPTK